MKKINKLKNLSITAAIGLYRTITIGAFLVSRYSDKVMSSVFNRISLLIKAVFVFCTMKVGEVSERWEFRELLERWRFQL